MSTNSLSMGEYQQSIASIVTFEGKGLHTGVHCKVTIKPAKGGEGIKFCRVDLPGKPLIDATAKSVTSTQRGTVLGSPPESVSTVEHLMATLFALGVDNALIEVDGPELPILDGSAVLFAERLATIPLKREQLKREFIVIKEPIDVVDGNSKISLYPDDRFSGEVMIDFNSTTVGIQSSHFDEESNFIEEIAPARTFVFLEEILPLLQSNLIKGGGVDSAIIVSDRAVENELQEQLESLFGENSKMVRKRGYLNVEELHFENELARHKLLDLIGDLALTGKRIKGRVVAKRPGHKINTKTAKLLIEMEEKKKTIPSYDPNAEPLVDINGIKKLLPHRPPFLMVDRISYMDKNEVVGIKTIGVNEGFFIGHFPEEPVMPGVLIIESMAQVGGILVLNDLEEPEKHSTYFVKIDNAKFRRKVVPGDVMVIRLKITAPLRRSLVSMKGEVYIGDTLACEADLMAQVIKNKE